MQGRDTVGLLCFWTHFVFVCLFNRLSVRNTPRVLVDQTQAKARARLKSLYKHAGYEIRTDKNRLKKRTSVVSLRAVPLAWSEGSFRKVESFLICIEAAACLHWLRSFSFYGSPRHSRCNFQYVVYRCRSNTAAVYFVDMNEQPCRAL